MKTALLTLGLLVLVAGTVALAERPGAEPSHSPDGQFYAQHEPGMDHPGRAPEPFDDAWPPGPGRQFEKFRMNKMFEMLGLTGQQRKQMKEQFERHRADIKKLEDESQQVMDTLIPLVRASQPDEKKIEPLLKRLDSLDLQRDQLRREFKAEADQNLTVVQRAKLRVFDQRFERQMIQKVRNMRERRGGMRGNMPPPPIDDDSDSN